jgi:cell division transport system ATP-binding protein
LLKFENVYKTYKDSTFSLSDINIEIADGDFVFIIGKSGSGKTTLLKLIYGEEKPDSGKITFSDTDITAADEKHLQGYRRKLGLVFQEGGLIEDKNVYENVAYPLYIQNMRRDTVIKRTTIALRLVGMIYKKDAYPNELSGGEKQKACLARAMASDPLMMIADEPTGNIDPETTAEIMHILRRINEKGTTVIVATHDMEIVREFGGRVIKMTDGTAAYDLNRRTIR